MKIAITYENGNVFQHFGHTEQFKIYNIDNGKVVSSTIVSTGGKSHGALVDILKEHSVEKLICGGIGVGAKQALAEAGIILFGGTSGNTDEQLDALLCGELKYNPNTECGHHGEHRHEHICSRTRGNCNHHQ